MSSSPEPSFVNGDGASPFAEPDDTRGGDQSDSDLSEVNDTVVAQPRASPSASHHDSEDEAKPPSEPADAAESSPEEDNNASDGDFDMDGSPGASQSDGAQDERSASNDSRPAARRKAPAREEEYIMANPELYGLRRSVRCLKIFHAAQPC